jgi:hypothetical protein
VGARAGCGLSIEVERSRFAAVVLRGGLIALDSRA